VAAIRSGRPRRALRALQLTRGSVTGPLPNAGPSAVAAAALIDSVMAETPRIECIGTQATDVAHALPGSSGGPLVRVLVEAVGDHRAGAAVRVLSQVAEGAELVVMLEPAWRGGEGFALDGGASSRPKRVETWRRLAERAGCEVAAEMRPAGGRLLGLALRRNVPDSPAAARAVAVRPAARVHLPVRIRIHDDLSLSTSFAWIMGKLALALHARGAEVSIAPTALAPSFSSAERERLRDLMTVAAPRNLDGELGWTHYWKSYQRPLGGRRPLALFAINYTFDGADHRPLDPWLAKLAESTVNLAPISSFCLETLRLAGIPEHRLSVVPMGLTSPPPETSERGLPGSRGLNVLHVTNSVDPIRLGTYTSLEAFQHAFAPGDPVTLVVRDYGPGSAELAAAVAALRQAGHDVRYWPVFLSQAQLGKTMQAFQVLLAPFRGEGFGIKLLDAMATGLAPIAPLFGGATDFLSHETAFVVPHRLEPMTTGYDAERLSFARKPLWAKIDPDDVATALRTAMVDRGGLTARRAAARQRAAGFTWDRAADAVIAVIRSDPDAGSPS
jgi:glycosyltransferase involved in cell wall biosynthesis